MSKVSLRCFCLAGLLGASLFANAQNSKWKFDYIGFEAGVFRPTSGLLRERFGSSVLRLGLTPMMVRRTADWRPSLEIGFIGASGHGDHFGVYPVTIGVQKSFGNADEQVVPFVRAGVGGSYFDYSITDDSSVVHSGHKIGATTAFEAGIMSGKNFRASVRYYLMPKQSGVDFSGLLFSASIGIFKL